MSGGHLLAPRPLALAMAGDPEMEDPRRRRGYGERVENWTRSVTLGHRLALAVVNLLLILGTPAVVVFVLLNPGTLGVAEIGLLGSIFGAGGLAHLLIGRGRE